MFGCCRLTENFNTRPLPVRNIHFDGKRRTSDTIFYPVTGRNVYACMLLIYLLVKLRTTREMITKRISGQQKQPGSFILQAEPLSRSYHVAESICRIYNSAT